jgi:predicted permease
METLLKDLRYGYRTLLRNPGFTFVAVLSLALGIGANTAIFSFIDTVLLKQLPVRNAGELLLFGDGIGRGNSSGPANGPTRLFSWREYQDFRKTSKVFEDIVAIDSDSRRIYASFNAEREPVLSTFISGNYFDVLGVRPEVGQVFDTSLDRAAVPRAVLSDAFWTRRFHRDPGVVGTAFRVGSHEYTVIGVAARGFFGTRLGEVPDVWLPATVQPDFPNGDFIRLNDPKSHFMNLIGRLRPGVTPRQAEANINVVYQQLLPTYIGNPPGPDEARLIRTAVVNLTPADKGLSNLKRKYQTPLVILMIVVALVLVIACANVANLLVALGAKRQREVAVRVAIGAGRGRLIRQLLTEGILLSGIAGILGILVALGAGQVLVHLISTGPRALPIGFELDGRVLGFTIAVSLLTGIVFSLAPALRASRVDLIASLKEGKSSMASPRKITFGRAIVVSQVALSLTLLVTAGMLLRSFANLIGAGTGFDRENVLLFKIDSESSGYKQDQRLAALYGQITESVSRVPGVVSGSVSLRSYHEGHWTEGFTVPGVNLSGDKSVSLNFVTPAFFDTFRIPLLTGRKLEPWDNAASEPVAVIGESFARKAFGAGANAIGRTFLMSPLTDKDQLYRVVGVVRDVKTSDVRDKEENLAYLPLAQAPVYAGTIAVRVQGDPAAVASRVRATIRSIEPNLPIRWTTTLAEEVSDSLVSERALAELSAFFAGLALLLSAIGLYGTISFAVARRTSEIGIRMALGAEQSGVLGMVLKDAMVLLGVGIAVGLPLSIGAGRALGSLLYGLGSFDPVSASCAVVSLAAVTAIAGYLPARRASRVDPIVALRYE